MSEAETEAAIVAAGKTAPRVTPADLDAVVREEFYIQPTGTTLTICILTLYNGFLVTGESAAADPANFDPGIGMKIARDNARNKLWPLLGYQLKERLYQASLTPMTPAS